VTPAVIATNVHCGQTVTASVTLNGDLFCDGPGLIVTGTSINLNLGGHQIVSNVLQAGIGVELSGKSDTVQNGVISDFLNAVEVDGTTDTVLNVRATSNYDGIYDVGTGTKITTSVIANSPNQGLVSQSSGATYSGVHLLNNDYGITVFGTKTVVTGSVANGNTYYGFYDGGDGTTLTKNVANFNGGDGIRVAENTAIDGAGNTAKGNDYNSAFTPIQCWGVVCS
jgi:Periplasmic copper-binding protein (NosD)